LDYSIREDEKLVSFTSFDLFDVKNESLLFFHHVVRSFFPLFIVFVCRRFSHAIFNLLTLIKIKKPKTYASLFFLETRLSLLF